MMRLVILFVGLAYALSWSAWIPIALTGGKVVVGEGWPTHMLGLLGPAFAAAITSWLAGREARAALWQRCRSLPQGAMAWTVTLSPLAILGAALVTDRLVEGQWPNLSALGRHSGVPELGVLPMLALILIVNGFGEEIGRRGFLLPRLQSKFGPLRGTLVVWPIWLIWHLPLFGFLANFQSMDLATAVFVWGLGLLAGTLVLANVMHIAGGSVFAAALWHTLFNVAAGPGLSPMASAVATTIVMIWAVGIVIAAWHGRSGLLMAAGQGHSGGVQS